MAESIPTLRSTWVTQGPRTLAQAVADAVRIEPLAKGTKGTWITCWCYTNSAPGSVLRATGHRTAAMTRERDGRSPRYP
jgi:hypothetical protein